jgi:hypothetical protein
MGGTSDRTSPLTSDTGPATAGGSSWTARYGAKHRWVRLAYLPAGLTLPEKVRVYQRAEHFLLNWWDPQAGKNLSERVTGDLLAALTRARQIDDRLTHFRTGGAGSGGRLGHGDLVAKFLADLARRADAGEVAPNTVGRYRTALDHYLEFAAQPDVARRYPLAARADRDFRLGLAAYLAARPPRGRRSGGHGFVLDAVRAAFAWAADPDRGGLLPDGFRTPFRQGGGGRPVFKGDPLAGPAVTMTMVVDLVRAADAFQLRLFAPLALFGLRAAEPCLLFADHLKGGWLRVPCVPELDLWTKGRSDKSLPLVDELAPFWDVLAGGRAAGLLLDRRAVLEGHEAAPLRGLPLPDLIAEYRRRCAQAGAQGAAGRRAVRVGLLRDAGGLNYDDVEGEFRRLAARLGWPRAATLKGFRHLFATGMNDAGMPDAHRRYLLGHSPGRAAVAAYTHLSGVREIYAGVLRGAWAPLAEAVRARAAALRPE